jgi:hypothetical protein
MKTMVLVVLLVGVSWIFVGCSSPETRAESSPEILSKLSANDREAALKGELRKGMNADAVFIALGEPSEILKGTVKGEEYERWIYTQIESTEIPIWRGVPQQLPDGTVVGTPTYEPHRISRVRETFEVKLEDGKVVDWKTL